MKMVSLNEAKVHIFISAVISLLSVGEVVSNHLFNDNHMTDSTVCKFEIIDIEKVKNQFIQLSTVNDVQMIRFNVDIHQNKSVPGNKSYFRSLNELYANGLERWMWILKKHSNLLTYSPDFEVVTLNRSTSMQRNIYLPVEAFTNNNETGKSHYKNCMESLFLMIFKDILNQTNSNADWLFCHRYFEGQEWKLGFLYKATGAWIGYDFECFSSYCQNTQCAQHIEKGRVNVIINISILVVVCYFPLLFLLLPKRTVKDLDNPASYSMGDQPFSLTRYIFRLNSRKKCIVNGCLERFSHRCTKFSGNTGTGTIFDDCLPEISLISFLYLIVMLIFFIQRFYFPKLIPDFNKYAEVYHPCITYNLLSDCDSEKHNFDLILGILSTIFAPMYFLVVSLIYIHSDDTLNEFFRYLEKKCDFSTSNSKDIFESSPSINHVTLSIPTSGNNDSSSAPSPSKTDSLLTPCPSDAPKKRANGYTKLAMNFLDRISRFFSADTWQKLFNPPLNFDSKISYVQLLISVPLKVLLKVTFLLIPIIPFLLDVIFVFPIKFIWGSPNKELSKRKKLSLGVYVILYLIVISLFILFCFSPYFVYILQSIIRTIIYTFFVAGPLFTSFSYDNLALVLSISLYVIKYVVNFYQIYKNLLDTLLKMQIGIENDKQPTISVDLFKQIVDEYVPLRTQLVMLSLKILVTSLFLYVAIDTLGKVGKEDLFKSPLPALVATIMPILAEKLCSSDPQMEIKLQKGFIQKRLEQYQVPDDSTEKGLTITAWIIIFPAFYTILRPVVSLFDTLFPKYKDTNLYRFICCTKYCGRDDVHEKTPLLMDDST